jgi:probable HAF family extracellular repeat protein
MSILAEPRYTITDIGTLPGGSVSIARAINNAGWVVGEADTDEVLHAFIYSPQATWLLGLSGPGMIDLGTLGGPVVIVKSIDEVGQVVGYGETARGTRHAFVWPRGGVLQDLGPLGGKNSFALDITVVAGTANLERVVVGVVETAGGAHRAFLSRAEETQELGTLGGQNSAAAGVNRGGQVVGDAETASGATHAFLFSQGQMHDLGTLGGRNSSAAAINTAGQVVGTAERAGGARHAFLFSQGQMQDLGTLGGQNSAALAINTAGQMVGTAESAGGTPQAFVFSGAMVNLNTLLPAASDWELLAATGINDSGQIVGSGLHHGSSRAFLMTPRPG